MCFVIRIQKIGFNSFAYSSLLGGLSLLSQKESPLPESTNLDDGFASGDRRVEVQLLRRREPYKFVLVFENFPVWVCGLEPSKIRTIHFLEFESYHILKAWILSKGFNFDLLERFLSRFGDQ
jgi:hypothetical protein